MGPPDRRLPHVYVMPSFPCIHKLDLSRSIYDWVYGPQAMVRIFGAASAPTDPSLLFRHPGLRDGAVEQRVLRGRVPGSGFRLRLVGGGRIASGQLGSRIVLKIHSAAPHRRVNSTVSLS